MEPFDLLLIVTDVLERLGDRGGVFGAPEGVAT